ncbi:hypothetical protein LJA01_17770 [Lactobacillus japonicus]|nr:hypothetical protein LJA01_17770 [Lactobacillus japonicus]
MIIKSVLLGRDRSNGTDFLMLWHLVTGLARRRLGYKGVPVLNFNYSNIRNRGMSAYEKTV